jgi:hypothetical protein
MPRFYLIPLGIMFLVSTTLNGFRRSLGNIYRFSGG